MFETKQVSRLEVFTLIMLLMVFGAANTIILKLQTKQKVNGEQFSHPYIQGCVMFLGEGICIFVYLLKIRFKKTRQQFDSQGIKPKIPVWLIAIPASLDFIATNISYVALNLLPSSVWQLSKGGSIITTALFARLIIKRRFTRLKLIGCLLVVMGITVVGVSVVAFQGEHEQGVVTTTEEAIGIALVVGSLLFTGLQVTYEEKLFRMYTVDVFQMVGMEGVFGLGMNAILVLVLSFIPNPWHRTSSPYMQSVPDYFSGLASNSLLLILVVCQIFSMAISVSIAVTITKRINSVSRSIVDVARVVLIWAFGYVLTLTTDYKLESTYVWQILVEVIGFLFVISGTILYHSKKKRTDEIEPLLLNSQITESFTQPFERRLTQEDRVESAPRESLM